MCDQPKWDHFTGFNAVQNFYVTYCIWNTNGFFLDMYTAIGDAHDLVSDKIGKLVSYILA